MESPNKLFQVSLRTILEVVAIIAVILVLAYRRPENKNGRYQLTAPEPGSIFMTDTATGQVWHAGPSG
jgi:hypothetical protein